MAISRITGKSIADGSITSADLQVGTIPTTLVVAKRTGSVNIGITNATFTVVARTGNISVGVS